MNKKLKFIVGVASLVAVISIIGVAQQSFASDGANGEYNRSSHKSGRAMNHQGVMPDIMENKDFSAWEELMGDKRVAEFVNEENFNKLVEAHELMMEGKYEESKAIRTELGIPGINRGMHKGEGRNMERNGFIDENGDGICDHRQK